MQANFFKKDNQIKNEIVNVELSRVFIKKVFPNKNNLTKTIILQIAPDIGVFIDTKFVKIDSYTLNANIGIALDYDYTIFPLSDKNNDQRNRVKGDKIISMIKQFSEENFN